MVDRYALFKSITPNYMAMAMGDFDWLLEDAAACFGNAGHESGGFMLLQEQKPTVQGSRGGFGWYQWTGPRRVAYENYCRRNNLDPSSHGANYKFLFVELKGPESRAVAATRNAGWGIEDFDERLMAKVKAFELAYERAGIKHYPSRLKYAKMAYNAYSEAEKAGKLQEKTKEMPVTPSVVQPPPSPITQPESRVSVFARIFNKILKGS